MDKNQIINLVVNNVVAIVAAILAAKWSRSSGTLGVTSKLKQRFTPTVKASMLLIFCLLVSIFDVTRLYRFVGAPNPPMVTRGDVLSIGLMLLSTSVWVACVGGAAVNLAYRVRDERARKLKEQWQPLVDDLTSLNEKFGRIAKPSDTDPPDPS